MAVKTDIVDTTKRVDLAGQTVYDSKTGMNVTYNENGYVSKATRPGVANTSPYRAPSEDAVKASSSSSSNRDSAGGSSYDKQYFTDNELANADYYRQLASSGAITWDEANQYVENIRKKYGYTGGSQGDQYNEYTGQWDRGYYWGLGGGTDLLEELGSLAVGGSGGAGSSGGKSSSGSSYGSSGTSGYGSYAANDLSSYLQSMYDSYTQAQLAALESAYKQNLADLEANAEQIPQTYQTARNEAAAQNDLARQSFNEYAAARGLNSGTSGQAALANSAVLQSNMADISTQEADALAANALQQQKLAIEYQNAAVQAQAEGNYQLAQALYSEYVRQDEAAMQAAQLAQSQANWQAEFDASRQQYQNSYALQQQQYQDSLAAQQQEYAYNLAMTMLSAGIMPDSSTLSTAGISSADAIAMRLSALSETGESPSFDAPKSPDTPKSPDAQNELVSIDTSQLGAAARGLWNIIQQLGDNASAAAGRIENYLNSGKITDKEAQILASAFGY